MFNITGIPSTQYVGDVTVYNWVFTLTPTQQAGGLVAGDIFPSGYHLGLMAIDWGYTGAGYPVKSIVANSADISTNQTVTLNIVDFNTSTYLLCFFVYYNATSGITQINDPSEAQINAVSTIYPLEDGILLCGIENYYHLPAVLWTFPNTQVVGSDLNTNNGYILYEGVNLPTINNEAIPPAYMTWDNYNDYFSIEPSISPSSTYKWNIKITAYKNGSWVNNQYKCLFTWNDTDTTPVSIFMKTDGSGIITLAFVESGNTSTPIFAQVTTATLSSSSSTPTVIEVSNFNSASLNKIGLKVNGTVYTPTLDYTWMTQAENPPIFNFGYLLGVGDAPVGLNYTDIEVSAYGKTT